MMSPGLPLLVGLLALLSGCKNTQPNVEGTVDLAPPALTSLLKVAPNDPAALDRPQGETRYNLSSLSELYVRLQAPQLPSGVSWMKMEFYRPTGGIYHERHVPFSVDEKPQEVASPDGIPHPVQVETAKAIPDAYGLDQAIRVAGTNLTRYPQPGLWTLKASLDEDPSVKGEIIIELGVFQ